MSAAPVFSVAEVTIRRATLDDLPFVRACVIGMARDLEAMGGPALVDDGPLQAIFTSYLQEGLQRETTCFYIAAQASVDCGLVEVSHTQRPPIFREREMLHVSTIYVLPAQRGRGIAAQLLEAALDWGRERGCTEADLNVLVSNPAQHLYRKLSFVDHRLNMLLNFRLDG